MIGIRWYNGLMATSQKKPTIAEEMRANPPIETLFEAIHTYLQSLGPVEAFPHKTQISFGGKAFATNFAFVWLPQMLGQKVPQNSLTLTFDLPRQEKSRRIRQSAKLRKDRWVHHVVIAKKSDLDRDIKAWLRESFEFGKLGLRKWRKQHDAGSSE
jgi:hypothetical protein